MTSQFRKYSDIILGTDDSCSNGWLDASKSSRSPLYYNSSSSDKKNGSYLASSLCSKDKLLKQKGYRLFHVNTCSLLPKIPELRALAERYHIHLMSINETHLDETVNDFELEIPGFVIYRNDRNRHGGGVALYVRDDVKHKPRKDLTIPGLESVWIEMSTPDNKDYLVCSMYRPPSASAAYYDKIIDNLELASSKNMEIIVMADLNFNYILDESLSTNPVHLIENLFLFQQSIDEPTRATLKSSTLIDVILSSSPEEHITSGVLKTTFSDHYSIFTVLQVHKTTVNYNHKTVKFRDYKNFKDEAFLNDINSCSLLDMVKHETDIDNGWEVLKSEFKRVSDAHAPFVERRLKHRNNPWITPVITKMIYERNHLHDNAIRFNDRNLWQQYKKKRNAINNLIKDEKRIYHANTIKDHKYDPKKMWKRINELIKQNKSSNTGLNDVSASKLNAYFSTIGDKISSKVTAQHTTNWKNPPSAHKFSFRKISTESVANNLRALDSVSANDVLQLDCKLLNISANALAPALTHLFNLSLQMQYLPNDWKLARVTPIYKGKGEVSAETNYRPISVISHVAKIFEKEVHTQVLLYLERHAFITPFQSAYLKRHSTVTCLHRVIDDICEGMDDGLLCGMCFLDIEKCFDTINHSILLRKLKCYGINETENKWFENYLSDRHQCVRIGGVTSEILPCTTGVPQGSILGPLLFLIYVNDICQFVGNQNCNVFADDTILYSFGTDVDEVNSSLQLALNSVENWYSSNLLSLSKEKSVTLLVRGNKRNEPGDLNVTLGGHPLKQERCMKYLGVYLDQNLSWNEQCDRLCVHIAGKLAVLRRIRSFVKPDLLKLLFEKTIQPVFDYACTVWGNTSQGNMYKLQRAQNYAARLVSGNFDFINHRGEDIVKSLNWPTVTERFTYLTACMMFKAVNGLTPNYISDNVAMARDMHDRDTRLSRSNDVHIPPHNSAILKRSFMYNGSVVWNNLSEELKALHCLSDFKKAYKMCS